MTLTDGASLSHFTPTGALAIEMSGDKFWVLDVVFVGSIFYLCENVNSPPHFFE